MIHHSLCSHKRLCQEKIYLSNTLMSVSRLHKNNKLCSRAKQYDNKYLQSSQTHAKEAWPATEEESFLTDTE